MKTEIWVTFNYGGWRIAFKKEFEFPFTPSLGIIIQDDGENGAGENTIELIETEYRSVSIYYNTFRKGFEINVREHWNHPVSDETIDGTIEMFMETNWTRCDTTDILELKNLMKRDYERTKSSPTSICRTSHSSI
jgi:hypothetical protein